MYWAIPTSKHEQIFKKQKKKVPVPRPALIRLYKEAMGGVGLLDASVAMYRIHIKGKKGWWQHFVVLITYKKTFYFVRFVVQSYLHVDKIAPTLAPDFLEIKNTDC